jgi:hypothetical protein
MKEIRGKNEEKSLMNNTEELANDCCRTTKSDYVFGNCFCGHLRSFDLRIVVKW